jgi:hypothetical protein
LPTFAFLDGGFPLKILSGDLDDPRVRWLLEHHLATARAATGAARSLGMSRLSLETGSWPYFQPARALYRSVGFVECAPFGEYVHDPNSVFMSLDLRGFG